MKCEEFYKYFKSAKVKSYESYETTYNTMLGKLSMTEMI